MKRVIADTGSLYAAYDSSDRFHAQALTELDRLTQQNLTVLVPYPIFLETHSLILKRLGNRIGFRYIHEISAGSDLIQPTVEDYQQAILLIQQYQDQAITGTEGSGTVKALLVYDGDEESGSRAYGSRQSAKYLG